MNIWQILFILPIIIGLWFFLIAFAIALIVAIINIIKEPLL